MDRVLEYIIEEQSKFKEELELKGMVMLKDLQKLSDIARMYDIDRRVLDYRLKFLKEGIEYIKLGERQPTILTPRGIEKILNIKDIKL